MCPKEMDTPFLVRNITFITVSNVPIINGTMTIRESVSGPIGIDIAAKACDMRDSSQCRPFPTFLLTDMCKELENPLFGTQFASRIRPKLKCPIKQVCTMCFTNIFPLMSFVYFRANISWTQ